MAIKKEIYPKTKRLKCDGTKVQITEKLDGSNLVIFKLNDTLCIAQRKTIFRYDELEENKSGLYKGLYQWIKDNYDELNDIHEGSAICGEWLGMGCLKYTIDEFDKRFYMFAKANVYFEDLKNGKLDISINKIIYDHDLFIYPFENQEIPKCIGIVPVVANIKHIPDKIYLDGLYQKYCEDVCRNVEGFVVNYNNMINKYVRMKNGKLQEHFDREEN